MTEPEIDPPVQIPQFRFDPNGLLAIRFENNGSWRVATVTPTDDYLNDAGVADWIPLVLGEIVSALAKKSMDNLNDIQEKVNALGDLHNEALAEITEKADRYELQVQAMREFAIELSSEPLAGRYFAAEINRRLDEAGE